MAIKPKAIILRTAGTNCDQETAYALETAGAKPELVHINQLFRKEKNLLDYHLLLIPGGFSYGDDIAAGKIFANEMKYKLGAALNRFVEKGYPVLGICNGFQILVKCGLLPEPALNEEKRNTISQTVTLTNNDSAKFECRWIYLKKISNNCIFTKDLPEIIYLPIAHGEGKFVTKNEKILENLKNNKQIVFKYVDEKGREGGYPVNPNGSLESIAAVCNPQGNIMGMMPHPERFVSREQHPRWTSSKLGPKGDGLKVFSNAVNYAKSL